MANSSDRDINLVIRAKNDATKAIDSVAAALQQLANVQDTVGRSAAKQDGLLGELAVSLDNLNQKAKGLAALAVVARQIDKATEAVGRLENQAKAAADAAAPLAQKYEAAAQATAQLADKAKDAKAALEAQTAATNQAKVAQSELADQVRKAETSYRATFEQVRRAKAPSDELKQSLRTQADALAGLYRQQTLSNETYAAQKNALASSRVEYGALQKQVDAAASSQGRFEVESTKAAEAVGRADAGLAQARGELSLITELGKQAAASLGGVALSQDAISAAAKETAASLDLVKAATDRQAAQSGGQSGQALGPAASATAAYRAQIQAVRDAQIAYTQARLAASGLGAEMAQAAEPTERLATDFLLAKENAAALEAEYRRQAQSLNDLKGVTSGFNTFLEREAAVFAQVGQASAAGAAGSAKFSAGLKDVESDAQAVGKALQPSGGRSGEVLFGLRPYELQNLSYQINDVISGLASGQHVTQIVAQQGGQIFQLFQRQIFAARGAIISLLPEITAAVAVGATLIDVVKTSTDRAASFRQFSGQLSQSADGIFYDPTKLAATTREIQKMGTSLKDARLELKGFVEQGVNTEFLDRFAKTAQNVADATGVKVPEAAKQMAAAFTGGYDAIKRLDDATNFLTASEREHIKALFDEGNASWARNAAFEAYERQQDSAAQKARGPWSEAFRNLGTAWKNFVDFLGQTPVIRGAAAALDLLAEAAKNLTDALPGAGGSGVAGLEKQLKDLQTQRALMAAAEKRSQDLLQAAKARNPGRADDLVQKYDDAYQNRTKDGLTTVALDQQIASLQAQLKTARAADPENADSEAKKKARQEQLDSVQRELSLMGNLQDVERIRLAGEHAYQDAIRATGDIREAEAQRDLARAKEVERQRLAVNFGRVSDKIIGIEGTGSNPNSTATGSGQFVEATWLQLFKKYYPVEAAKLGRDAILELRKDSEITKQLVELYARQNAEVLQKAGIAVTEASLYLAHFLGPDGAQKVLKAAPNTPVASLLSSDAIAANASVLKGKTAGDVVQFAQGKIGTSDYARATLDAQGKLGEAIAKKEVELQQAIDDLVNGLKADAAAITKSKEDQFVASKVSEAEKRANDAKLPLTDANRKSVTDAARSDFQAQRDYDTSKKNADLQNQINAKLKGDKEELTRQQYILNEAAKAEVDITSEQGKKFEDLQGKLYDLTEQQKAFGNVIGLSQKVGSLQGQIKEAFRQGDQDSVKDLQGELADVLKDLRAALPAARQFANALGDQKMIAQLGKVDAQLQKVKIGLVDTKEINQDLAQGGVSVFDRVAEAIANVNGKGGKLKDVLAAARDGLLQFAGDFLKKIAEMILQQQLLNLLAKSPIGGLISSGVDAAAMLASGTALSGAGAVLTGAGTLLTTSAATWAVVAAEITAGAIALQAAATTELAANAVGVLHGGGVVGSPGGMTRKMSPSIFRGAARYHKGGVAGLKPDEVPAILQRNERVLTEKQQREVFGPHSGGGGGQGASHSPVKVVNVFDPGEVFAAGLATEAGQKVIFNHVRQNKDAWNSALGRRPG